MPIPAYVKFKGKKSGEMKGSVAIKGREGTSEVIEFDHNVYLPSDKGTGRPTGTRVHGPLKLTKAYDSASPLLYAACCNGETLTEVTITWYAIDETGAETEYFTHKLENAKVAGVRALMPNTKDPEKERYVHQEEVLLVYEAIEWTYKDGNIMARDAWLEAH
ncbi:MAG: Hcp family type VI secretion system effector [Gemmatimonadaceae bacterium]